VIVGAGVVGASVASALSGNDRSVLLLDRERIGHSRGSSHGTSRFRQFAPYPTEEYLDLGLEARRLWTHIEDAKGIRILHRTGNLSIGDTPRLEVLASTLEGHGMAVELVEAADAAQRWPFLRPAGPVVHQSDGEVIAADVAWRAMVESACAAGVELVEDCAVQEIRLHDDSVSVRTDRDDVRAERLVLATGPWIKALAAQADIDVDVTVTRQTVAFLPLAERIPTITDWSGREPYALPDLLGSLKVAEHARGQAADPDSSGSPDLASAERVCGWAERTIRGVGATPLRVETCLYTNVPGDQFIVERQGPVVLVSACNGQGFQYAPAMGRRVADLVAQ